MSQNVEVSVSFKQYTRFDIITILQSEMITGLASKPMPSARSGMKNNHVVSDGVTFRERHNRFVMTVVMFLLSGPEPARRLLLTESRNLAAPDRGSQTTSPPE